jgi:hypothetical protein
LGKGTGDYLDGSSESLEGPLLNTLNFVGVLLKAARKLHLDGTTTGDELGVKHDIASNTEGVVEVALNLVEDILGGTTEKDGASLGALALSHEGEVIVTNLLDFKKTALGTNIRVLKFLRAVDNGGARDTGNTVIIGLTDTTDDCAVSVLEEEVLSSVGNTLFGDDNVGLDAENVFAHFADFLLFHLKSFLEVVFLGELHVGH